MHNSSLTICEKREVGGGGGETGGERSGSTHGLCHAWDQADGEGGQGLPFDGPFFPFCDLLTSSGNLSISILSFSVPISPSGTDAHLTFLSECKFRWAFASRRGGCILSFWMFLVWDKKSLVTY